MKANLGHRGAAELAAGLVMLACFLGVWELAGRSARLADSVVPPSAIIAGLEPERTRARLVTDIWVSTRRVIVGFVAAALVAVPLGVLAGTSRLARGALSPFVTILRPLPSMSWIPLSIIWFGGSERQKEFIVFMGSLPPILVYTSAAMAELDPVLVLAARNLGARPLALVREVILPGSLPQVLAGLRVAFAVAWTCVISAELVLTNSGLGRLIMETRETGNLVVTYTGMVAIVLVVLVLTVLFERLERRLTPWRRPRMA